MKKYSKQISVILVLSILFSVISFFSNKPVSASASSNDLTITQVGDTKSYGGGVYRAINMQVVNNPWKTYTVNTNTAAIQFRVPSNYHTGNILRVNGIAIQDPSCVKFNIIGDYSYITLIVPDLYDSMINRVEVIDGGVGCPQVSSSIYIQVA